MDNWKEYAEEQNKDLETKKVREELKLELTDKQLNNLKLKAYKVGFKSESELLSAFISDLTGWQYRGSNEARIIKDWYDTSFGKFIYYFRYYLFDNDFDLSTMQGLIDDDVYFDEVYEDYKAQNHLKKLQSKEECFEVLKEVVEEGREL